jgi:hypothetical protein
LLKKEKQKKEKNEIIEEKSKENRNTRKTRKKTQQKPEKPRPTVSLPVDGSRPKLTPLAEPRGRWFVPITRG